MLTYAIGDIHGQMELLQGAHERIAQDRAREGVAEAEAPVVHIGDLVDRGPRSADVLSFLISGQSSGANWLVLKGNHDRMFARFLNDPMEPEPRLRRELNWLHERLGGLATLASYGVDVAEDRPIAELHADALAAVPDSHRRFLAELPDRLRRDALILVHAGLRPKVKLEKQVEDDLVWIRDEFLNYRKSHGALVVHGHTPVPEALHYGNRVNIDSGAAFGGPLTAVAIEGSRVFRLGARGREELLPIV